MRASEIELIREAAIRGLQKRIDACNEKVRKNTEEIEKADDHGVKHVVAVRVRAEGEIAAKTARCLAEVVEEIRTMDLGS